MESKCILYFGSYAPEYPRNQIIKKGLEANGITVLEVMAFGRIFSRYLRLTLSFIKIRKKFKVMIVGFPGYPEVPLAWILAKVFRKYLIFDAFYSLHDTYINDRQIHSKYSFYALKYLLQDYICCHLADLVLLDTEHHANYFINKYRLNRLKVKHIYIGADEEFFKYEKRPKPNKNFIVEFHGSFQRLQGVSYIIEAANALKIYKDIKLKIVGDGLTKKESLVMIKKYKLNNVNVSPWQNIKKIKKIILTADVSLGIFGKTDKAYMVIPNKAYEAIALSKPVITMDSLASRELFKNKKNALLVDNDNPISLAKAILLLKNDKKLYNNISKSAYILFKRKLTSKILGNQLIDLIKSKSRL